MNILLVEDDPGIGRFVSRGLATEGNAAHWVRTGREGEDALKSGLFDVVILDLGLPDIDGATLCERIRRAGVATPVLILTARDGLDDKLDGFAAGADDYLTKPFAFAELLARLNALGRRRLASEALSFSVFLLDGGSRNLSCGSERLPLSGREFGVMACLMRAQGAVVSRSEILDQVWGEEAGVTENTVDVYVGYLRRRITVFGDALRIDAVRGVGFRLVGRDKPLS
ncbi:MAG TPA: response regulator transcription factor [Hyphomonadaceae bacterium]|nr:response regulator transcription factor [Hyphomonadaceae bacterium]